MKAPILVLFDDLTARGWMPFALTRPVGELLFGALTLRERIERVFATQCVGHLTSEHLRGFDEEGAPPVVDLASLPTDRDLLFVSSRLVPAWGTEPIQPSAGAGPIVAGAQICGWYAPAGSPLPPADFFLDPVGTGPRSDGAELTLSAQVLERPWELIGKNEDQLTRDILALFPAPPPWNPGPGVHVVGDAPLIVDRSAVIDPGVVIDLRDGPVWIDSGANVAPLTRLAGPAYIGRETKVLGGQLSGLSVGPVCRIHGEVEASIVLGYTNKSHDGFLGHAYLGRWVNLGAMTTNSDLKNNYGSVRIWTPDGEVDTGETKLGCMLGDHVKTAIGTLLNTGTVVGAGANLFGERMPPRYVPPFSWGIGADSAEYDLERFIATAKTVMSRRNVDLTTRQRALLEAAWMLGRGHT